MAGYMYYSSQPIVLSRPLYNDSHCLSAIEINNWHAPTYSFFSADCDYGKIVKLTSKWPRWRLKSPAAAWLFTQSFIQAQIKENIKALRHWPLCGEFTGTGEFPAQRASNAENISIWWRHHDPSGAGTGLIQERTKRSKPWLRMFWLLASPSHHQPYWPCRINGSLSNKRKCFIRLWHHSFEKSLEMQTYF